MKEEEKRDKRECNITVIYVTFTVTIKQRLVFISAHWNTQKERKKKKKMKKEKKYIILNINANYVSFIVMIKQSIIVILELKSIKKS